MAMTRRSINRFDLAIDWGWFRFITKRMFTLIRRHLSAGRKFRRGDPDRGEIATPKFPTSRKMASISVNIGLVMKRNQPQSIARSNRLRWSALS